MSQEDENKGENIFRVVVGIYLLIVAIAVPISIISNWPQVHRYGFAWIIAGAILDGMIFPLITYLVAIMLLSAIVYVVWPRG